MKKARVREAGIDALLLIPGKRGQGQRSSKCTHLGFNLTYKFPE
jgi:hypothetical protein